MYSLVWGKAQQLSFTDDHEYYRALGSLCRGDSYTITYETNSDTESWSDAFRIKCLRSDSQTPDAFINAMRTARRINCNDYVQNLYEFHGFDFDVDNKVLIGRYDKVKQTVPSVYHFDFDEGYNLRFIRYDKKATTSRGGRRSHTQKLYNNQEKKNNEKQGTKPESLLKPAISPKPEPLPVVVNVGEILIHKAWGEGQVFSVDGRYLKVLFASVGEKSFVNPEAFEKGFLSKQ